MKPTEKDKASFEEAGGGGAWDCKGEVLENASFEVMDRCSTSAWKAVS